MHSNTLYDWEEDGSFFEERFLLHYFVFLRFPFPAILRRLDDFSELGSKSRAHILAMHQCVLQKMAYMRGHGRLYLSKEPESMTRMEAIAALYPDARFIILTRRSCEFLGSLFALIRQSTLCKTGVDPIEIPGWREANLEKKKRDCELMVDLAHKILPRARQLRLSYAGATRDIAATLLYVYEALGLTIPEEQRRRLPSLKVAQEHRKRGYDYEFEDADGFTRYDDFALNVERRHLAALTRPRYREQARAKARLRSGQDGPDSAVLDPQAG